ncbi:MAG: Ig-like domain-containing protein [Clostridia bacterium]|nr:Ig-like domain-containing protein [Clostridia bacterium]
MNKKLLAFLLLGAATTCTAFGFAGCNSDGGHTHNYGTDWESDSTYHWHECLNDGCNDKVKNKEEHVDKLGDGTCYVCGYPLRPSQTPVTSVELDKNQLILEINGTTTLNVTVNPEGATDKTVTWTSDKPEIVKVEGGKVTALAIGTAVITATAHNGVNASCTVTVKAPTAEPDALTGKTFVFDRFDSEDFDAEFIEMTEQYWAGGYIQFKEEQKVTAKTGFVCGSNARYELHGNEIHLYPYPDEYPTAYRTFTYSGNEIALELTVEGQSGSYVYVLQTAE